MSEIPPPKPKLNVGQRRGGKRFLNKETKAKLSAKAAINKQTKKIKK